jgi:four helix bundle protein
MGTVRRFEELECWQGARAFVVLVYGLTNKDRFRKDLDLVSQVKRSAISAMANIAEGFHRKSNREFMKFLDYSRSSIAETVSHVYVAFDQAYIDKEELEKVKEKADLLWRMVNNFISYLNKASAPRRLRPDSVSNRTD